MVSSTAANTKLLDICNEVTDGPGLHVDSVQVSKLITVAAILPYSIGKVAMNFADGTGDLTIEIQTKKSKNSKFDISGSKSGDVKPLAKDLIVQAKLFQTLLRVFSHESSICISLSEKGIGIKTDNYIAALLTE